MSPQPLVHGRCDANARLIEGDERLIGLHLRCGGEWPGTLAVPSLLALVRHVHASQIAQMRQLGAVDQGRAIAFLAHAAPDGDGTRIQISQWRMTGDAPDGPGPDGDLLAHMAPLHALLDTGQRVLAATVRADDPDIAADAPALNDLVERWHAAPHARWTDALDLVNLTHRQPLHWRLLDDVAFQINGSARLWRARIAPRGDAGFDLLILADALGEEPVPTPPVSPVTGWSRLIGRDLAPALRQPINRIVANAETIRTRLAGPLADEYAGYAADIAEAGRHLLGLVDDLADLDAVENPDFAPAPDPIDLADCARRAAGILAMRANERGITLVTPAPAEQVAATGEFRRVLQILLNLLTNAIRYAPAHSIVTITAGRDGAAAWVAVSDQGAGLTAAQGVRVFEKFERLGRSGDGGSGLGLYIARRLARAMHGDLTVAIADEHQPGGRFVLSLPSRPDV